MAKMQTRPPAEFLAETREDWRKWLAENHETASGCWLIYYKKGSGKSMLKYEEGVEEALCFGWIDATAGTVDAEKAKLYYAPRNPKSGWSRVNKIRIEKLLAEGKMMPKGLEMVKIAQKTGTWTALDDIENGIVPEDLEAAFALFPASKMHFDAFPKSARRALLDWIRQARTPLTRAKRVEETARSAGENIRANQWSKSEKPR